ncbi:hypothetical protein B0T16DRAFT_53440 [Cercophora newfieldiana]|uniref:F-box domain-containing protein n=1 Tax=Cercophora newfieldiana TaxID=92897 RepID=A0AA40CZB0_9PEZI|nr:hypothetical protein B0T16DRAFT_53440 [Cercophora newfieldiana]
MTEVTSYPNPHDLGASSRRLLAPAPSSRAQFFAPEILTNMSFPPTSQSYYGASRQSLGARSSSVSSSSSSASYNAASSRILSPALPPPASSTARVGATATHRQQNFVHRPPYVSQSQSPFIFSSAPQFLPSQTVAQFPLCAPVPTPRSFPQVSAFGFQQRATPSLPPTMAYQSYPSGYPPYSTYQAPSQLLQSYPQHYHVEMQDRYRPSIFGSSSLPLSVLQNITSHLGYLDVIRLSWVNKWLHAHVDPDKVPEEEKIALMLRAEQEYKRYSLRTSAPSAPEVDDVGRDGGYLACYHCFRMKPPQDFELFRYNGSEDADDNETEASTPRQTPASLPTSNPHYDPSITGSSIASRNKTGSKGKIFGQTTFDQSSPRIKETWGTRRFCIPCGVKKGYYKPGALIELRTEKPGSKERKGRKGEKEGKEAKWICNCYKIHKKPETLQCETCNGLTPMSQNRLPRVDSISPYSSPFASSSYIPTTNS